MKTALVSARFPKEEVALEEKTDKTTALRRIFGLGAQQYNLEKAIKQYQKGRISIGKAAEIGRISIWEMQDELKLRGIQNAMGEEEYQESLRNIRKVLKK